MLDCLNNFLHGFVAVPTVLACREKGFFTCLEERGPMTAQEIAQALGGNEGHLRAALRMMHALGWLLREENRTYRLTPKADLAREIPSDIMDWFRSWTHADLTDPAGAGPGPWIDRSLARWQVSDPLLADFLDGVLVIPLLLLIRRDRRFKDRALALTGLADNRRAELSRLFIGREWAVPNPDGNPDEPLLTDAGRFLVQRALLAGVTASYTPMLSRMPELLFGDPRAVFDAGGSFHEPHLDRDLNVVASGFQHSKYFEDVDEIIVRIFDGPMGDQPDCIVDMGCGDGALLFRIHETIRTRTARGRQPESHPVRMIGVDFHQKALAAAARTLAHIPHLLFQGDVGDPERLAHDLKARGVDPERVLHIRSFLDHERPFVPPRDLERCEDRAAVSGQGVFVDREGRSIPAHIMARSLVEHLERWAGIVNRHGLILLEVHSLPPEIVSDHLSLIENLHFDACHAFSMQHLTEADVFLAAAAAAGLFPKTGFSRNYPGTLPFSRITLHRFEKRAYTVRHVNRADLPALCALQEAGRPSDQRVPEEELRDRIERYPGGQFAAESEGRIIGAAYSLQTDNGKTVRPLEIVVLPEFLPKKPDDQLRDFMLEYSRLIPGVETVVEMPRPGKKAEKTALPSRPGSDIGSDAGEESPDLPRIVAEAVCRVLGSERAADYSPKRPLMMMGLDSLELMELRELLGRRPGVSLKPTFFFRYRTPEAVVGYLRDQEKGARTSDDFPREKCLHHLFEAQALKTPDAVAVVHGNRTLTYAGLDRRANQLAHRLRKLGAGPDAVIGLCLERSLELIIGVIAILKAGGGYMPLDPAYPGEWLSHVLESSGASLVLTQTSLAERLPPGTAQILCMDSEKEAIAAEPSDPPACSVAPRDLLYVIYTSGSTGRPKGVAMPHSPLVNLVWWQIRQRTFDRGPRVLQFTPISFDVSCQEMFSAWASGGTLVVVDETTRRDPMALLRFMEEHSVECLFLPFVALQRLAEAAENASVPSTLWEVITAGEQLQIQPALVRFFQRLPQCRLYNQYGPAETHVATQYRLAGPPETWPALPPIGRPLPNCLAYILDEKGRPVPEGKAGELYLGGVNIARGYLHRPELTAERFLENTFTGEGRIYKTGDLARYLPDGDIGFLGRGDHQVKIRGIRVEPGEIEVVLAQHPAVKEAAVAAGADGAGPEKRLVAYVVPSSPDDPSNASPLSKETAPALNRYLAEKLPEHMVPSRIMILPALPLTPSGKIDRRSLPEPSAERPPIGARYVPPASPTERRLAVLWGEILRLDRVGIHDPFFDLGGNSLLMAQLQTRLARIFPERPVRIFDLFQYPTVAALARYLDGESGPAHVPRDLPVDLSGRGPRQTSGESRDAVAIIGMACRFPGASDPETFWENLRLGRESITFFGPDELEIDPRPRMKGPDYVRARAVLPDIEGFDARFFGYSDREAELLDPQHRLFLECAWESFESAGYVPETVPVSVGVYAGVGMNTYLINNVNTGDGAFSGRTFMESAADMQALISSDKDFLPTHAAYRLNLRGPAVAVQAACSTGLVAVHQACRSLIGGECGMALAGASGISVPQRVGYWYQPDMIFSPDGHCRAFDAEARGTVFGNGVGAVLLKRLDHAVADGDPIYAVIRGSAVNNDGAGKVGFTAPGAEAQAAVIAGAHASAGIDAREIGYVEAHGTGTALGDPVEMAALTRAFQRHTQDRGFCAVGSVKTNVGHLATAAGIAGLIKTVLAIHKGEIPPSLNFTRPNPRIDFDNSPFFVNTRLKAWEGRRLAGVSAFGMGGTNAHLVLEQAPERAKAPPAPERPFLFTLSARSEDALAELGRRYADWLEKRPDAALADICFTSTRGRTHFEHRRALVVRSRDQLIRGLRDRAGEADSRNRDDREEMLKTLGQRYVRGESIDWTAVSGESEGRRIPMPTYPFQRRRYWISPAKEKPVPPKVDRAEEDAPAIASGPSAVEFHGIRWRPLQWHPRTAPPMTGRYVIFADSGGLGRSLSQNLAEQGADCVRVFPGEAYRRIDSQTYAVHPSRKADFERLFQDVADIRGIVYLWSLDVRNEPAVRVLPACCSGPLHLIQALGAAFLGPRIWLVTRESQAVLPDDRVPGSAQAAAWGLGRVMMLEHPEFSCACLDIGSDTAPGEIAAVLWTSPREENAPENQLALRRRTLYGARLEPVPAPVPEKASGGIEIRPDACYLITGGLGGLGRHVARWLGEQGARHIVLNGRKAPEDARTRELIADLTRTGASVRIEPADISRPEEVRRLIAACSRPAPLAGIIHGAGVLEDGMLMRQSEERFSRVFGPKALGAWHLHEQSLDLPLDFFVCFSSAASVLGNAGQGNYAAANAFVDALMQHRRALGLPGLSVSWGPWTTGGMAAELHSRHHRRLTDLGYLPIRPREGISALAAALGRAEGHLAFLPMDWTRCGARRFTPFLKHLIPSAARKRSFPEILRETPPAGRRKRLAEHVRKIAVRVLGSGGEDARRIGDRDGFFELGMDSLGAIEMRNALQSSLGAPLPPTAAFDFPTVEALVDHLLGRLFPEDPSPAPAPADAPDAERPAPGEIEDLSEEEAETMLMNELNRYI